MLSNETNNNTATENTENTENTAAAQEPSWYWDESTPGQGERPEWLKEKYSKVTDQAKAYIEAEKYIGQSKAPEAYDLKEFEDYIDLEAEQVANLTAVAKQHKLSQEALNDILNPLKAYHKSLIPDINKEIEKLGPHAKTRIETVNTWATNNLSEKALEAIGNLPETAEVVELLDEIRQLYAQSSRVPTGNEGTTEHKVLNAEDIQEEIKQNYQRYRTDAKYRRDLQEKLYIALGDG